MFIAVLCILQIYYKSNVPQKVHWSPDQGGPFMQDITIITITNLENKQICNSVRELYRSDVLFWFI